MPLSTGHKIGPYSVNGLLGAGGMGEVYRARDTNLGRDVALKMLPETLANDADHISRFQREARTLASLNHPNIAAIYGLVENAIVMELAEGRTLAELIDGKPIPVPQALAIARQIAEALDYAHEQGVIHRDLKPANVKITREGRVKVLDFGLAKALSLEPPAEMDPGDSPTLSASVTQAGVVLGTPAYMSPEQARGLPVDKRTDIWGFGAVVFEMLTGQQAFPGQTPSNTRTLRPPRWRCTDVHRTSVSAPPPTATKPPSKTGAPTPKLSTRNWAT